jgi:hypothetical protein
MLFLSLSSKECLKTGYNHRLPNPYPDNIQHWCNSYRNSINNNNHFVSRCSHMLDLIPGLISVTSNPPGVEFPTSFIAGTKVTVPIAYTASCCRPTVDMKATDAKGNYITWHIDANAGMSTLYTQTATTYAVCVFILIIVYGQAA